MTTRTIKAEVTFRAPFLLTCFDETLPAGTYHVEIDEELLGGVSFPVYRRVAALLYLHSSPARPGQRQVLTVDLNELETALERDKAGIEPLAAPDVEASALEPKSDASSEIRDGQFRIVTRTPQT